MICKDETRPEDRMTVEEAGRRGGKRTLARHGPEFFERIGRLGGRANARNTYGKEAAAADEE